MKNIFKRHLNVQRTIFAAIAGLSLLFTFASCSNGFGINDSENVNPSRAVTTESLKNSANVTIKINLLGVPSENATPGVWAWAKASADTNYTTANWPGDMKMTAETISGYSGYTYSLKVDNTYDLGILFNNLTSGKNGSPQTKDIIIPKSVFTSNVTLYFNWNSMAYYKSIDECIGILGGSITALDTSKKNATVTVTTSLLDSIDTTKLSVKDSAGNALVLEDSSASIKVSGDSATIKVKDGTGTNAGDVAKTPYTITYNGKDITAAVSISLVETTFAEPAAKSTDALGLALNGTTATFRTWAPTATKAEVLLYADSKAAYDSSKTDGNDQTGSTEKEWGTAPSGDAVKEMTLDSSTGIWVASDVNVSGYKYYKYRLTIAGIPYYVSDIWHTVAGPDSVASQIATIDDADATPTGWESSYVNPFGSTGTETKKYNDAVIYEMHIRDWSRAFVKDSTGKFLDIANNLGSTGDFAKHLKDLGVTHVQILPMFDYAQINSNKKYNWGYNPYHYNVPEGRYVTDKYTDGTQAVKEMRQMIQAFHDAGIAVIMDVVYNHTSGTLTGSLYDSTVPGYFYKLDSSGSYIDGTGCGNETDNRRVMVKKYFLESLKHWVNDYHINGFRFDLMGAHDKTFMKEVYDTLYQIDKNILVYGEPWSGSLDEGTRAWSAGAGTNGYGYGAFDDDFRDAVKGAEYGGFNRGQVQGKFADENLVNGLKGVTISNNKRNETGISGLALRYAECHDNYTLFDKLVYSTDSSVSGNGDFAPKFAAAYKSIMSDSSKLDLIKKEDKLAAAYVILSQGTPFINGGQEFMRTKKGNPDSYSADTKGGITWTNTAGEYNIDDVNTIDLSMKTKFADVYNVYRGLIALRKDYSAFRGYGSADAEKLADGVTKYTVSATDGSFTVVFNATDSAANISGINGKIVDVETRLSVGGTYFGLGFGDVDVDVDVEPYRVYKDVSTVSSVPAKSFVILKTN